MKKSHQDKTYFIEEDKPEFNQMAFYNIRMDKRSDDRDLALIDGDLVKFYRGSMALYMNAAPRLKQKGMQEDAIKQLKKDLKAIGAKIKGLANVSEKFQELNSLAYQEELFEYNIELNQACFDYGLIFPMQDRKELRSIIKEDFE